jgi:hypothetical protein
LRKIAERIHCETGFIIYEYESEDGSTCEIIQTDSGEEIELKLFEQKLSRYL